MAQAKLFLNGEELGEFNVVLEWRGYADRALPFKAVGHRSLLVVSFANGDTYKGDILIDSGNSFTGVGSFAYSHPTSPVSKPI